MIEALKSTMRRIVRFHRKEDGGIAMEFVILYPMFMWLFFSGIESALMMTRHAMLERGVDMAMRELRLNTNGPHSFDQLKKRICSYSGVIQDCLNTLQIELVSINTDSWTLAMDPNIRCIDRANTIDPISETNYQPGVGNQMMMVRVCAVQPPIMPATALGAAMPKDSNGLYRLVSVSAFVNEPN